MVLIGLKNKAKSPASALQMADLPILTNPKLSNGEVLVIEKRITPPLTVSIRNTVMHHNRTADFMQLFSSN